ncbi:hypothetical protein F5B18DRAFT_84571 [Nemania serpens]|nr:hypothetical protein F5B18DRAFT_84571 [Nemania serpens]
MAPSSKNANPAPDYTVSMNRVQTQLEAQLRIVRAFMPARPAPSITIITRPTPAFSSLATQSLNPSPNTAAPSRTQSRTQANEAEENLFAAQDPNAGLGFGGPKHAGEGANAKGGTTRERERENQVLRSRLLGGRKRGIGTGDTQGKAFRRVEEQSSDEEPGRSGLGRAKKRARREEDPAADEDEDEGTSVSAPVIESEALDRDRDRDEKACDDEDEDEDGDGDGDVKDGSSTALLRDDSILGASADISGQGETKKNKKRKKKKKKKEKKNDKSKEASGEHE